MIFLKERNIQSHERNIQVFFFLKAVSWRCKMNTSIQKLTFTIGLVGRHVHQRESKEGGKLLTSFGTGVNKQNYGIGRLRKPSLVYQWCQLSSMVAKWQHIKPQMVTNRKNSKAHNHNQPQSLLIEARMFPIEASAKIHLLSYLKKVENMDKHQWPKLVVVEELN